MTNAAYTAIMAYRDQMINVHTSTTGLHIAIFASHVDTIRTITKIARNDGARVSKCIVAKGDPDAEMHLTIR